LTIGLSNFRAIVLTVVRYGRTDNDQIHQLVGITTSTSSPIGPPVSTGDDKWLVFDGTTWIVYDVSRLDDSYHRPNQHEEFHIRFQTDQPDGLLWFNGNSTNHVHVSIKVCRVAIFSFTTSV